MQPVLALLKGRRVSLDVAWRVLSPKSSLVPSGVRTYYAMICMSVSERGIMNISTKQHISPFNMLLK
jgi:hypothetical protein